MVGRSVSIPAWLIKHTQGRGFQECAVLAHHLGGLEQLGCRKMSGPAAGQRLPRDRADPLPRYSSSETRIDELETSGSVAVWTSCREANSPGRNVTPALRGDPSLAGRDRPTRPLPGRKPSVDQPNARASAAYESQNQTRPAWR